MVRDPPLLAHGGAPKLAELAAHTTSPSALADLVAAAVLSEPTTRLAVIEELDVAKRLDLVTGEVAAVTSFNRNGIVATSNQQAYVGSWRYGTGPVKTRFGSSNSESSRRSG